MNSASNMDNTSPVDEASELIKRHSLRCMSFKCFWGKELFWWGLFNVIFCVSPFGLSFVGNLEWGASLDFKKSWMAFNFTTIVTSLYTYFIAEYERVSTWLAKLCAILGTVWAFTLLYVFIAHAGIDMRVKKAILSTTGELGLWLGILGATLLFSFILVFPAVSHKYLQYIKDIVETDAASDMTQAEEVASEAAGYMKSLENAMLSDKDKF